jgi:Methyltransferase domain
MGCRNCGSNSLRELGFVGQLAPFFLKRVFNIELHQNVSLSPLKQFIRKALQPVRGALAKIYSQSACVEMQICMSCSFVQSRYPFAEGAINRLYLDYRSAVYNAERISFEPSYKLIADRVGNDDSEVKARVEETTTWLQNKLEMPHDFTMLDFGGADGRFLPNFQAKKFVYEISNMTPREGIARIADEAALGRYSYVHLAHVLEHIVDPFALTASVVGHVEKDGYLYIEVPQEMSDADLDSLKNGNYAFNVPVHEHINRYSLSSVTHLMEAVGLKVIAAKVAKIDLGWGIGVHVMALGRKS